MHDVGKVAAPDHVLLKPGSLTASERQQIEAHTEVGHRMLADSPSELLKLAASIARTHHERVDGHGYSQRLAGAEIPLEGRIVAIADVFDALTRDRVYRGALPQAEALAVMAADTGHFDTDLFALFVAEVVPSLGDDPHPAPCLPTAREAAGAAATPPAGATSAPQSA